MIDTSNIELAKQMIKKSTKPIIVVSQNESFNRKILEYGKFDILLSPEKVSRKDSLKQADSGFNEYLARTAAKNHIKIGIDISELKLLSTIGKSFRLARISQNIKLCRKANAGLAFSKDEKEARNLLISLGASTSQASLAQSF